MQLYVSLNLFSLVYCEANAHNVFKTLSSPLPGTNQYWCHIGIMLVSHVGFEILSMLKKKILYDVVCKIFVIQFLY